MPLIIGLVGFPIASAAGIKMSYQGGAYIGSEQVRSFGGYRTVPQYSKRYITWVPLYFFYVLVLAGIVWAWRKAHPMLEVTATPAQIRVGHLVFMRRYFGGMRTGYTIGGEKVVSNSFDFSIGNGFVGAVGLRVSYGRWGEDTNFMLNKYHAPEYVVWMNEQIAAVGAPSPRDNDYALGRRKENFGG